MFLQIVSPQSLFFQALQKVSLQKQIHTIETNLKLYSQQHLNDITSFTFVIVILLSLVNNYV